MARSDVRDGILVAICLLAGGVVGWFVRDLTIPQPQVEVVLDTVRVVRDRIVAGEVRYVTDTTAVNRLARERRELADSLNWALAQLQPDTTVPPVLRETLARCQRLTFTCQVETDSLRGLLYRRDTLLAESRGVLDLTIAALDSVRRAQPRCAGSPLSRGFKGLTTGSALGMIAGGVVGAFAPRVGFVDGLVAGAAGGALGGIGASLTIRCSLL